MLKLNCCFCFIFYMLSTNAYSMAASPPVNLEQAIQQAINRYGRQTESELKDFFKEAEVRYPPKKIALLAFKKEQNLQLWAKNKNKTWRHIHTYPLTASSGALGPKLKEYDFQIPEGIYQLTAFNPFSQMHLSMKINYPNAFDKKKALKEGRTQLGGDIFLHGKAESVGCLAIGNHAIDQLFMLSHQVGLKQIQLIIAPNDFRLGKPRKKYPSQPRWLPELYRQIENRLARFPIKEQV
ncbi:MAG: L,D-transpeptidase family protein [Legionella sp.]|nr:L,D-transpeptidase family protein [Legionella sp.]